MSTSSSTSSPPAPQLPSALRRLRLRAGTELAGLIPLAVLVVLVLAVSLAEPSFLGTQSLKATAITAGPILLLAFGSTLVILIGGFDLSVAALTTFGSVLLAKWLPGTGSLVGVLLVVLAATGLGALQGWVHGVTQIPSFIVTLGGLGIFTGLALLVSDATAIPITENTGLLDTIGLEFAGIPNAVTVVVVVLVLLAAVMRYTPLGRDVYALGAAEPAARMSGTRALRVRVIVFATSGMCAGLAAVLLAAQTSFGSPTLANNLLLPTVAAVVVGGTAVSGGVGGLGRSLVGGLIVTTVTAGTVVLGFDPALQNVAFGIGVLVAVALTTDRRKLGTIK